MRNAGVPIYARWRSGRSGRPSLARKAAGRNVEEKQIFRCDHVPGETRRDVLVAQNPRSDGSRKREFVLAVGDAQDFTC